MKGKDARGGEVGQQEIPIREGETDWGGGHEKRVWGAPAFQVTPDPGPLCQPGARLSGGFVGASSLNGHPADRHVVYPLCVLWGGGLPNVFTGSRR